MPVITMQHKVKEIINKKVQLPEYEADGPEPSIMEILQTYYDIVFGGCEAMSEDYVRRYIDKLLEDV